MLTDQALILWGEQFEEEGVTPTVRLALDQITSIGVKYSDWFPSTVSVDSGEWNYSFSLSSENGSDRNFITELETLTGVKITVLEPTESVD